jgi:hypothetical protein
MLEFDNIVDAVHSLNQVDKSRLRILLDEELKTTSSDLRNGNHPAKGIVGLFADEPELMDRVMETVDERRSRPLRLNQ